MRLDKISDDWTVPSHCVHGNRPTLARSEPLDEGGRRRWRTTVIYRCPEGCTETHTDDVWPDRVKSSDGQTVRYQE